MKSSPLRAHTRDPAWWMALSGDVAAQEWQRQPPSADHLATSSRVSLEHL